VAVGLILTEDQLVALEKVKWTRLGGPLGHRCCLEGPAPSSSRHAGRLLWLLSRWACGRRESVVQAKRHVHGVLAQAAGDALAPYHHRGPAGQGLVRASGM
jgi:hypothetical protein